ncbi:MAG: phospholipase D-like domain-containing protein, partial [Elusimicrobiota bacterium]|nr:phospholipase D-like domain-containing protein [Elusimicrobiota bacterium]
MTKFGKKAIFSALLLFFTVHCPFFTASSYAEYDGDYFSVYFTRYNTATPPYTTEDNANNLAHLQALVDLIDSANSTIDVATYELNNSTIVAALKAAEDRSVTIKIIYDAGNYDAGHDNVAVATLSGSVHKSRYSDNFLSHNKYMIVDSTRIWTGSTNFTPEGFGSNTNNSILLRDCPGLIANYQQDFNEMWINTGSANKTSHGGSYTVNGVSIQNYFSPKDFSVSNHLKTEVSGSSKSVLFLITFGITQSDLLNTMYSKWDTFRTDGNGVLEGVIWKTGRAPYTTWDPVGLDVR